MGGYGQNLDGGSDAMSAVACDLDATYVRYRNSNGAVVFTGLRAKIDAAPSNVTTTTKPSDPGRIVTASPALTLEEQSWIWLFRLIVIMDIQDNFPK